MPKLVEFLDSDREVPSESILPKNIATTDEVLQYKDVLTDPTAQKIPRYHKSLRKPSERDPSPGCPGSTITENDIERVENHYPGAHACLVKFKNYAKPRWIHWKTAMNLEPKGPLKLYLRVLRSQGGRVWVFQAQYLNNYY
jgi:hypothetical protein